MENQPRILIIDDEPDNFDVIDVLLESEGYELSYASNGKRAFALLKAFQPDVILLDVMMPEMSGIEFCQRFKANSEWGHIPIIMVTALQMKTDLAQCLTAGADDFVSKPVNGVELRARVASMLRIKQQYDNLQMLLKLREDMVNMMVHDLRNPLFHIILSASLIQKLGPLTGKQQTKLEQLEAAGHQLQSMIDTMLLMAKIESGKMKLNYAEIDLAAICSSAVADIAEMAAFKALNLVSDLPDPGRGVWVDAAIFRRILDNLLSNAIKFSPKNREIIIQASQREDGGAIVQVIDSGPGVSDALRQHIFEKYEVGTLMQGVSQMGLGLAFCKMAIDAHGGSISVSDNGSQGSIFTVSIPRHPAL